MGQQALKSHHRKMQTSPSGIAGIIGFYHKQNDLIDDFMEVSGYVLVAPGQQACFWGTFQPGASTAHGKQAPHVTLQVSASTDAVSHLSSCQCIQSSARARYGRLQAQMRLIMAVLGMCRLMGCTQGTTQVMKLMRQRRDGHAGPCTCPLLPTCELDPRLELVPARSYASSSGTND